MQSKAHSFLESLLNQLIGIVIGMGLNALVLPLYGFRPSLSQNLGITLTFTAISVARSYLLRRFFNRLTHKR